MSKTASSVKIKWTRSIIVSLCIILTLALAAGCASSQNAVQPGQPSQSQNAIQGGTSGASKEELKPMKLIFAHGFAPNQTWAKAAVKFKEAVEEKTDGKLTIDLFDSGTLGEQRKLFEDIMTSGTNDITITLEPISNWVPEINLYQLLYLFRDMEHLEKFEEGAVGQELKDLVKEKTGTRVLTYFARNGRQLTTSKKEVNSLEDLKGLVVRVTESKAAIEGWTALGAKPVAMPWGEVFTALQQGVIDAQENPFDHVFERKTYEVTPFGTRTNHVFAPVWLLISEEKYQALPAEWQQVIDEAALEAHNYERGLLEQLTVEVETKLKEQGFTIAETDLEPFRQAARSSYDKFPEMKEWIDKISAIQ